MLKTFWIGYSARSAWGSSSGRSGGRARNRGNLTGAGTNGPRESTRVHCRLDHFGAQKIAAPLGENVPVNCTGIIAHSTGEVSKSQTQTCPVEIGIERLRHQRLELTNARVLPSGISVILPGGMPGADDPRGMGRQSFIDHEHAERRASPRFPIGVIATRVLDQLSQLAAAGWRRVSNGVSNLMCQPEGNQLRIEPQSLRFGIRDARKVLEADESDALAVDNQLSGVGGADPDHQHHIDIDIDVQQGPALLFRISGKRDDIDSLQHRSKIYPARKCGRANDFQKMRTCWVKDVVVPVGFQKAAMIFEVAEIGGDTVGTVVNCEEVRQ